MPKSPVVLIILDGFGLNPDPDAPANAIKLARKPHWDRLMATYPHGQIPTSGEAVGLPPGQMGNSEVGHLNMGAGRVVYQELTRIGKSIHDGDFYTNPVLLEAMIHARARGTALHLMGLVSDGGVHSHIDHLVALLEMARRNEVPTVWIHAFTDGRDRPPMSGVGFMAALEAACARIGVGQVATVCGRYYAMDRDKRWDRVEKAWRGMVEGEASYRASSGVRAIELAYERGETDEFIMPTVCADAGRIAEGDSVVFFNFRADRARQITRAIALDDFDGFERPVRPQVHFACLTEYDVDFGLPIAYDKQTIDRILSPVVADAGLRQLRCAETEKYAHVTFFFNGGIEKPFAGEDRILIPSPKVATYDLQPEMSAFAVADAAVDWILGRRADLIVMNFANADMVGHTGKLEPTIRAIEAVDECVGRVVRAVEQVGGAALITADHGNAEMLLDPITGQPHTEHTLFPVPTLLVGYPAGLRDGLLSDVAPTLLEMLGLGKPPQMTARSLLLPQHAPVR